MNLVFPLPIQIIHSHFAHSFCHIIHTIWAQHTPLLLMKEIIVLGFRWLVSCVFKGEGFFKSNQRKIRMKSEKSFIHTSLAGFRVEQRAYFPLPIPLIEDEIRVIYRPSYRDFPTMSLLFPCYLYITLTSCPACFSVTSQIAYGREETRKLPSLQHQRSENIRCE